MTLEMTDLYYKPLLNRNLRFIYVGFVYPCVFVGKNGCDGDSESTYGHYYCRLVYISEVCC
jgi:hypothetical protein